MLGSVARTALLAGMPLTWAALVRPGQEGFLAAALLPDHRAVTIVVNQATSHAGLIAPGDRVDVIFTMQVSSDGLSQLNSFSRTVLENIRGWWPSTAGSRTSRLKPSRWRVRTASAAAAIR